MANKYCRKYALGSINDIDTTSTTQHAAYRLGDVADIFDDTLKTVTRYMYVYARNALVQYGLYRISYSNTAGQEVGAATFPASSSVYIRACIPQVVIASGSYGWVAIEGRCNVTSTGSTTKDHYGDGIKSIATCTDSGTTRTIYSVGTFTAARSGSGTVGIYLFNQRINIQA